MIGTILEMLGHELDDDTLKEIIAEVDEDGEYLLSQFDVSMIDGACFSVCVQRVRSLGLTVQMAL